MLLPWVRLKKGSNRWFFLVVSHGADFEQLALPTPTPLCDDKGIQTPENT